MIVGYSETAFPVGGFFPAEGGGTAVRATHYLRTVVGGVDDDRVIHDAQIVEFLEQLADHPIVLDHPVGFQSKPVLPWDSGLRCVKMCIRVELNQQKNGLPALCSRSMKSSAAARNSSSTVSMRFFVSGPVSSILPSA